jgi:hypothetical protein
MRLSILLPVGRRAMPLPLPPPPQNRPRQARGRFYLDLPIRLPLS